MAWSTRTGITVEAFWDMTLRENLLLIDGFLFRQQLSTEQRVSSAWLMANWSRAKRMPSLKSILSKIKKTKPRTKTEVEKAKEDFDEMVTDMTQDLKIKAQETDG